MRKYILALAAALTILPLGAQNHEEIAAPDTVEAAMIMPAGTLPNDSVPERDASEVAELMDEPADGSRRKLVYVFPIREDIMPSAQRLTSRCLAEATEMGADYVVIDMNTYGGLLNAADSIRTAILNYDKPVYVFINNQAASAGALIAIAADSIYMRDGASMGAATVVDQDGDVVPDKYQSFMRGMMRSTAESHGKVVEAIHGRDTVWRWHRDPRIAESMVDPSIVVDGLIGPDKVLTFSTEEAIEWYYCEGRAQSVEEVLAKAGVEDYDIHRYEPTGMDKLIGFLTSPALQGILIMLIIGGIYFALQTPGVGFPLVVAITAGLLYFAPLYVEGVLAHWELILFIIGVLLILVEIFVTPGFGVLGIAGIVAVVVGLSFAMIDTELFKSVPTGEVSLGFVVRPIAWVVIWVTLALVLSIWLGKKFMVSNTKLQGRVVLNSSMTPEEGYVSVEAERNLVGKRGITFTALRPAGKITLDGRIYEAAGDNGQFIEKDTAVEVVRDANGVLYCRKA